MRITMKGPRMFVENEWGIKETEGSLRKGDNLVDSEVPDRLLMLAPTCRCGTCRMIT